MITIKRTDGKNAANFEAKDSGTVIGRISSVVENDALTVYLLSGEKFIFDGMLRTALSCAEKEGAEKVFFKCGYEDELEKFGYYDGMDIKSFFMNKNCKNSL